MSWPCRMVKGPGRNVGDMWFAPEMVEQGHYHGYALSNEYKRDWQGKRYPIWVVLPSGTHFCIDSQVTDDGGRGWSVTGEAPNITVTPSINAVGIYHGFLVNGVLSEDVDGRTFDHH